MTPLYNTAKFDPAKVKAFHWDFFMRYPGRNIVANSLVSNKDKTNLGKQAILIIEPGSRGPNIVNLSSLVEWFYSILFYSILFYSILFYSTKGKIMANCDFESFLTTN